MGNISIFAKRGYVGNMFPGLSDNHSILRLSGETRGAQIAEYIGAKLNPEIGFESDLCIFVKGFHMQVGKPGDYVDFSDEKEEVLIPKLLQRPELKVIAHSQYAFEHLSGKFPNEMVCIPQQHINWENETRAKNEKIVAGYIGRVSKISIEIQNEITETLKEIDVEFKVGFDWRCREDAVNFYKSIDLLVLGGYGKLPIDLWQITPTKMINAASFGIPTIAFMRVGYKEFEGYYTQFKTMQDLIVEVEKFKDPGYYQSYSERIQEKAKEYHISRIGEMYKNLCLN